MFNQHLKLCLVTQPPSGEQSAYENDLRRAIAGGVTCVQLRNKSGHANDIRQQALKLQAILKPLHIPLLINDHVAIAKEVDAAGVHLGQSDMSPMVAREMLGPDKIIGWSIETMAELEAANQLDCLDYVAASAVFPSQTKTDCKTIWGLEGLRQVAVQSKHPVVAIGGITSENVQAVMQQGACGVAVVSAIHGAPCPQQAAGALKAGIQYQETSTVLNQVKHDRPLVLNIMNDVAMDFVANGLLSIGASPVMSKAEQDIEELLQHARAVAINVGTLNDALIKLAVRTCQLAKQLQLPVILDPVGAGATRYRTEACLSLLETRSISIVRGNASEIMALSGVASQGKGVDSLESSQHAIQAAKIVSQRYGVAVVVSGPVDVIVDDAWVLQHDRGSPLMPMVTGTGCLLSAVVAACHAVIADRRLAASAATLFYGICGEIAAEKAAGPGSFRTLFLDALNQLPERGRYESKT